jgi:3-oxoadipate enol-lactonase
MDQVPAAATFIPGASLTEWPGVRIVDYPIFTRVLGQGSPVLLIHGMTMSGEMFAPVAEQLAVSRQLLIPDLPGHGRSASVPGPHTPQRVAKTLADLLSGLQIEQATVLGYSQGGPIALQLAHGYPGMVNRLMLVCTFAFNRLSRREWVEGLFIPWIFQLIGPRRLGGMVRRRPAMMGGKALTGAQADLIAAVIAHTPRAAAGAWARAAMAFDGRGWLAEIEVPTLVVAGVEDVAVPVHHASMLAHGIPGAVLREIPDAGHLLIYTHPTELLAIVEEWEASQPS